MMADSAFRYGLHRAGTPIYQMLLGEEITDVAPSTYRAAAGHYAGEGANSWTEIAVSRVEVQPGGTAGIELGPVR